MPFVALQGRPLQSATIGYAITPNPVRSKFILNTGKNKMKKDVSLQCCIKPNRRN